MEPVTTWRDLEDEPYTKIINEAFPEPEPEPNTQYPHRPDYVGPSNLGKAARDPVGDVVTAVFNSFGILNLYILTSS